MLVRLYSKSFKLAFSIMCIENFQMYKISLEKAEEQEIKLSTFIGSQRKQGNSRKTSSASLITLKPLTVWITANCGKFFKRWEYQTTLPVSWETYMQVKKQQLEPDTEKWTGSKLGKEYVKDVYCHPACLTYMQAKCQAGWVTSWNQACQEKYQQPQICRWYNSKGRKWRITKEPLMGQTGEWKKLI